MNSLGGAAQVQGNKVVVELEPTEEKKKKKDKTSAVNQQASAISPLEKIKKKLEPKPKKEKKIDTKASEAASTIKPKSDDSKETYYSEEELSKMHAEIFKEQFKNGKLEKKLKLNEKIKNSLYQDKQ